MREVDSYVSLPGCDCGYSCRDGHSCQCHDIRLRLHRGRDFAHDDRLWLPHDGDFVTPFSIVNGSEWPLARSRGFKFFKPEFWIPSTCLSKTAPAFTRAL